MADARVFVHAAAALGPCGDTTRAERVTLTADPPPYDLRELVKRVIGAPLRQASHLVELAAIASQLCLHRLPHVAPEDTAVFVGTGLAEVRKTNALFDQVMPPGPGLASPFDFINAANNMAAFYVARLGQLRSRNLTVTQEEFSFEWALKLAFEDLRAGRFRHALVGGMDEHSQPRANHLRRLALEASQRLGEGAGFLSLSVEPDGALAEVAGVLHAGHQSVEAAVAGAAGAWAQPHEPVTLLPGFRIPPATHDAFATAWPAAHIQSYLAQCGCFHTASAFGLAALLDEPCPTHGLVLHVNRDAAGQVMIAGLRLPKR